MIKNNRGSVSILGIYLCYLLLFLTILIKAMLVENIYTLILSFLLFILKTKECAVFIFVIHSFKPILVSTKKEVCFIHTPSSFQRYSKLQFWYTVTHLPLFIIILRTFYLTNPKTLLAIILTLLTELVVFQFSLIVHKI